MAKVVTKPQQITITMPLTDRHGSFIAPRDIEEGEELIIEMPPPQPLRSGTELDAVIADMRPRAASDKSYCPSHVDVDLNQHQGEALRSLHMALVRRHATLRNGRYVDPNHRSSAVRWLLEQFQPA